LVIVDYFQHNQQLETAFCLSLFRFGTLAAGREQAALDGESHGRLAERRVTVAPHAGELEP
jgi:hypothetical protein